MKYIITLALIIGMQLTMHAQKTAFIYESKLLKATPGYEQAIAQMDTLKAQMQKEFQTAQALLNNKVNNLVTPYNFDNETTLEQLQAKLSETDKKKFALLQEESQLLEKQAKAKEEEYQEAYQQKVGTILTKINTTVKDYCKKNKIEILYKLDQLQPAIAYYEENKDITETLIKIIKD
jgi:Skp family chaperone for outer membrane proteins